MTAMQAEKWSFPWSFVIPPILLLLGGILVFGVNIPHWDDWDLTVDFILRHPQMPTLPELWQRHNEHRIPLLRLWIWISGQCKLGPKILEILAALIWALNLGLYARLGVESSPPRPWSLRMSVLLGLFTLSFCQREVLFWGTTSFQYGVAVLGALIFFRGMQSTRRMAMLTGFTLVYLSFPGWCALIPFVFYSCLIKNPKISLSRRVGTAAVLVLSTWSLFTVYFAGENSPSLGLSPSKILSSLIFGLRLLGSPFAMTGKYQFFALHLIAMVLGAVYVASLGYFIARAKKAGVPSTSLWLSIYALLVIGLISLGRESGGLDAAGISSRYTTYAIMGWFGIFTHTWRGHLKMTILLLGVGLVVSAANFGAEALIRSPKLKAAQVIVRALAHPTGLIPDLAPLTAIYPQPKRIESLVREATTSPHSPTDFDFFWN